MTHGSLFSGLGGFDYAAELMGWENIFHCEKEIFCNTILNYYWPNAISHEDIKTTDFTIHRGTIDVLTGGFPCQPYSVAGKRKGKNDERHLWPEMLRAIREIQPCWVVGENVRGLINWNGGVVFDEVQADLEAEGYQVLPFILPAAGINAPHRRDRIWFVAHACSFNSSLPVQQRGQDKTKDIDIDRESSERVTTDTNKQHGYGTRLHPGKISQQQASEVFKPSSNTSSTGRKKLDIPAKSDEQRYGSRCDNAKRVIADTAKFGLQIGDGKSGWSKTQSIFKRPNSIQDWQNFPTQPPVRSGNDGLSAGLSGITFSKWRNESIKALGNAIVPEVVLQIFRAIDQYDNL